ncbi:hypothetical protein MMC22_002574, partial [Lobaria immixta]|nr:hypothetical protein [Lobaria immixta]
ISARESWPSAPQKAQFSLLPRMAIDLLSTPAMSSDVEHIVSAAKNTMHHDRWNLLADTVEALQRLQLCFQGGHATQEKLHEVVRRQEDSERLGLDDVDPQ